ncbi:hypothetical protein [Paenibacillus apiarius]|uniref:hypothetical protein n=1 Tax=Paenibacillus apiarius TaxID=46240 RepID=UPI003B3BBFAB
MKKLSGNNNTHSTKKNSDDEDLSSFRFGPLLKGFLLIAAVSLTIVILNDSESSKEDPTITVESSNSGIVENKSQFRGMDVITSAKPETNHEEREMELETILLKRTSNKENVLEDKVFPIDSPLLDIGKVKVKIIGVEFGVDDKIGHGLKQDDLSLDVVDTISRGFQSGFNRAVNEEATKRDASLVLYIKAKLSPDVTSPRDVQRLDTKQITLEDDQSTDAIKIYDSFGDDYLKIGKEKYGLIKYAVYSDSKSFNIKIRDQLLRIDNIPFFK